MACADAGQLLQCLLWPHDARGVMRVGEDEQLAAVVDDGFQLLKVHLVLPVDHSQRVRNHLAVHALGH